MPPLVIPSFSLFNPPPPSVLNLGRGKRFCGVLFLLWVFCVLCTSQPSYCLRLSSLKYSVLLTVSGTE